MKTERLVRVAVGVKNLDEAVRFFAKGGFEEPRCKQACPAGIDVPHYIRLIREGRFAEALGIIREKVPFPLVLGYVCPRFCEVKCRRAEVDEPVAINALKRFVAGRGQNVTHQKSGKPSGKRVAIVGSGPAGLTAAYYLAKRGHGVTVVEALPAAGGMMRVGIPDYRLSKGVLDAEIEEIQKVGVEIKLNTKVESIDGFCQQGYDAIFLATGAHRGVKMGVEGEDSPGVLDGVGFLREVNLGEKVKLGDEVAVIGGGNVAIDSARTALRLGVKKVSILYRRSRAEMPAYAEEVEMAFEEGAEIIFLAAPIKINQDAGRLHLTCTRMQLGEPDASGRRRPEPIKGSEFFTSFDTVIAAIGQTPEISGQFGLALGQGNTIEVDSGTLVTSVQGVFAGGDVVSGPATVIEAIADGRKAAISIDKYLGGEGVIDETFVPEEGAAVQPWEESILAIPRQRMPLLDSIGRTKNFNVVELGFTEEMARREAERCLRCDLSLLITIDLEKCTECYRCQLICSLTYQHAFNIEKARIINRLPEGIHYNNECIGGCSLCTKYCPTEAISLSNRTAGIE